MKVLSFSLVVVSLLFALPVNADRAASIEEFLAFQQQVRDDLENGVYGRISDNDMDLVTTSQQTLDRLLRGKSSIDELNDDERIAVFNAQEAIVAVLTNTADERPICRRRHTVGSHRQITECFTPRQRRELAENARNLQQQFTEMQNRSVMAPPPGG